MENEKKKKVSKKKVGKTTRKASGKVAKNTSVKSKKETIRKTAKKTPGKTARKILKETTVKNNLSISSINKLIDATAEHPVSEKFNIVCFGDSITEGNEFPVELRWPSLLQEILDEYQPGKFSVHNKGADGDTTALALDRFSEDVLPLLPGMVLVQFGLNDANVYDWARRPRVSIYEFKKNLREFYSSIIRHKGTCIFIVNHAIGDVRGKQGNRKSFYDNFLPYNETIRYVADKLDTPCIDIYEMIRERGINIDYFVSLDKMHLTLEGNMKYAAMVYESITGEKHVYKEFD